MPLSERARVEVYVPDLPSPGYRELLEQLEQEFTFTFGGATLIRNLSVSQLGLPVHDRVNLLYTDGPLTFEQGWDQLSHYSDLLREAAFEALEEEAVLVAVLRVYHSAEAP